VRLTDPRFGYELSRSAGELRREGLRVTLGPYEARVLWIDAPFQAAEPRIEVIPRPKAATHRRRARPRAASTPSKRPVRRRARPAGPRGS
jgi:hypothetical protein